MATIKAVTSKASISRAIDYVTQKEKTEAKLMTGLDCTPEMAKEEMQATKDLWGKSDGRTYLHFVQSWHEEEPISHEQAHRIGVELAKQQREEGKPWSGFEVLVVTHTDRGHTHNHFIVNSVNQEDGKKIQFSPKDLAAMKERSDQLCRENDLSVCEKGKTFHGEDRGIEQPTTYSKEAQYIMDQAEAGKIESYIKKIGMAAIEVKAVAVSREDFCAQMADRGISVNWSDSRKNITFTDIEREMHGEKKCKVRDSALEKTFPGLQFSKESFAQAFEANAQPREDILAQTLPEAKEIIPEPAPSFDSLIAADAALEKAQKALSKAEWDIGGREREVDRELLAKPDNLRNAMAELEKAMAKKAEAQAVMAGFHAPRAPEGVLVPKKKKSQYEAALAEYREQVAPYRSLIADSQQRIEKNLEVVLKEFSPRERQKQGYGLSAPEMTAATLDKNDMSYIKSTLNFKLAKDIGWAVKQEERYAGLLDALRGAREALQGSQERFDGEMDKIPPEHRGKAQEAVVAAREGRKAAAVAERLAEREKTQSQSKGFVR